MVEMRCVKQTKERVNGHQAGSKLVFSSRQIETFRQMAQETRQSGQSGRSRKLASSSPGVLALFSGSSGTGKTMAAEVIARELGTRVVPVNLKHVVSKYIGETEKNFDRVLETAKKNGAVLFFDEADALFGKRSEVKDDHDRNANLEVSHLLSKLEAYRGLVILTTTRKDSLDSKVICRMKYALEFSPPISTPRVQPRS